MRNRVYTIDLFDKRYKKFVKKFPTLKEELELLEEQLLKNPKMLL